jgi:hypothetical protein
VTATLAELEPQTIIPDGIEPVEAFRCWTLDHNELKSLNGGGSNVAWKPGERLEAKCNAGSGRYRWSFVRRGMSYEEAAQVAVHHNQWTQYVSFGGPTPAPRPLVPPVPKTTPPDGFGFRLDNDPHEAPDEVCTCGIYAATTEKHVPPGANVYGKVKLWGKVVPGETGYRAQYAYPSEFRVAAELEDNETLRAFGVPIVVDPTLSMQMVQPLISFGSSPMSFGSPSTRARTPFFLKAAIAVNLGCAALNLSLVFLR